jgi:hypothetical protein
MNTVLDPHSFLTDRDPDPSKTLSADLDHNPGKKGPLVRICILNIKLAKGAKLNVDLDTDFVKPCIYEQIFFVSAAFRGLLLCAGPELFRLGCEEAR